MLRQVIKRAVARENRGQRHAPHSIGGAVQGEVLLPDCLVEVPLFLISLLTSYTAHKGTHGKGPAFTLPKSPTLPKTPKHQHRLSRAGRLGDRAAPVSVNIGVVQFLLYLLYL